MVFETGAREFAVNLDVAGAELECPVDEVDGAPRERGREKRPEVERAVALNPARNHHARERVADGQLEVRILLVVLEEHVVARPVQLDEVRLKHQRLDLVVGDDEFEVVDALHQLARLAVVAAPRLEVRAHAVAEVLRLPDVDNFPALVLVQIDAGRDG